MADKLYHIVSVNVRTTKTTRMTRYPMNHASCVVMMGKITPYEGRALQLEACSTIWIASISNLS